MRSNAERARHLRRGIQCAAGQPHGSPLRLVYANTAFGCPHATLLAMRGITGPLEVFEGNKGLMDSIADAFEIDWSRENLERVTRTVVKK